MGGQLPIAEFLFRLASFLAALALGIGFIALSGRLRRILTCSLRTSDSLPKRSIFNFVCGAGWFILWQAFVCKLNFVQELMGNR